MPRSYHQRRRTHSRQLPAAIEVLEYRTLLTAAGELDPLFGDEGKVATDLTGSRSEVGSAAVVQPDGKVVVAGSSFGGGSNDAFLLRYRPDGSPDATFGVAGKVDFGSGYLISDVAVDSQGRIVAAGTYLTGKNDQDFAVVRLKGDGTFDTEFDADGVAVTRLSGANDEIKGIAIDETDRIIAVGPSGSSFAYVRYAVDGAPDAQRVHFASPLTAQVAESIALQPDGKVVLAGSAGGIYFLLARLHPDGTGDASFGDRGTVTTRFPISVRATTVAIDGDGRIVVGGQMSALDESRDARAFALARYLPDGAPDTSFGGGDGMVKTEFVAGGTRLRSVLPLPDGRILAVGETGHAELYSLLVAARYGADGSPDTSFDGDGTLTAPYLGTAPFSVAEATLQPDGRVVIVGGTVSPLMIQDLALLRVDEGFAPDDSFDGDGHVVLDVRGRVDHAARAAAFGPHGSTVVLGLQEFGNLFVVSKYLADGSLDAAFGDEGTAVAPIGSTWGRFSLAEDVAVRSDGKVVAVGMSTANGDDYDVAMVRFNRDGTLDSMFGDGGVVLTGLLDGNDLVSSVAIQPDGKIVLGGVASRRDDVGFASDSFVARFDEDGSLDATFGDGGYVLIDYGGHDDQENRVVLQRDGRILVAGSYFVERSPYGQYATLTRLTPDGRLDESFGSNGRVVRDFATGAGEDAFQRALLYPDGRILAHAQTEEGDFLARFHPNGTADASFGDASVLTIPRNGAWIEEVVLQPDGKLVVGGQRSPTGAPSENDFYVARLLEDGRFDDSFAGAGWATADLGGRERVAQLLMNPTGGLVAAGTVSAPDGDLDFALARLVNDAFITGTDGDDTIFARVVYLRDVVGPRLQVWVNSDPQQAPPTHELPLSSIDGLHIDAGGGHDRVTLETSGMFPRTSVIGGDGEDRFAVTGTGTAAMIEFDGGGHNDTLEVDTVYSPLAVVFPIRLTAGDDADALVINGTSGADRYVFRASDAFAAGNHHITTGRLSSLTLNAGAGDDEVTIDPDGMFPPVTVAGGEGNDLLDVTAATSATVRVPRFQFNGQAGSDGLTARLTPIAIGAVPRHGFDGGEGIDEFRFVGSDLNDSVRLLINSGVPFVEGNGQRIDLVNVEQGIYQTGLGHDTVQVGSHPMSAHVDTGDGNDRLIYIGGTDGEYITFELASVHDDDDRDTLELLRGEFTFIDNLNGTSPYLTVRADTFAHVTFEKSQAFAALEVGDGSTVTLAAGGDKTMTLRSLLLSPKGTLDLVDNELTVLAYDAWESVLASIEKWVGTARNGSGLGIWRGAGITSTAAISNPLKGLAVWANDMIDAPFVPIMVKYTWNGDATLDGKINADDYFLIDTGFLSRPDKPLYRHGDFNYDDRINADDYFLIDAAFLAQSGTSTPSTATRLASVSSRPSAANDVGRRARRAVGEPVFNPVRRIRRLGSRR